MSMDVTERVRAKCLSSARILKYLDNLNQGVRICLRQDSNPVRSKSIQSYPQTGAVTGSETEGLENPTARGGTSHERLDSRVVRERLLMTDACRSQTWDERATLALKDLLTKRLRLAPRSVVRTADLYLKPTGMQENPTLLGVETVAQWLTNSTEVQAHVLVIYAINLHDPNRKGLLHLIRDEVRELYTGKIILVSQDTVNGQWYFDCLNER